MSGSSLRNKKDKMQKKKPKDECNAVQTCAKTKSNKHYCMLTSVGVVSKRCAVSIIKATDKLVFSNKNNKRMLKTYKRKHNAFQ
jgi:hypothetical protein